MNIILKENQRVKYTLEIGDILQSAHSGFGMICNFGNDYFVMDLSGSGGFFGRFKSLEELQAEFDKNMIENPNRYIIYPKKKYNLVLDEK